MPIYEYVCDSCKKKTEVIQGMNAPRLKVCPHCGGKLKKAFSAPAIQFKGSGWYVSDYAGARGEQKAKEAAADSKEGSEKAEKAEKVEKADKSEKAKKEKPKSSKSKASS